MEDGSLSETNVEKSTVKRSQRIFPLCIRQILSCEEDDFIIFGIEVDVIKICAIVRDYDITPSKVTYTVEDHTGRIRAVLWLETDTARFTTILPYIRKNRYVHIYGSYHVSDDNVKSLWILKIKPVEFLTQVTTHLLEVVNARYAAERQSKEHTHDITVLNPMQKKIYNILKADMSVNGVYINQIFTHFTKNEDEDVRESVEYLLNEGLIYTTINNDQYKISK